MTPRKARSKSVHLSRVKQDRLIEDHLLLARKIATASYRRLPNHPFEDILGAAHLGLLDAARRFKPSLGVPFEAYARVRISGSIIDAHRKLHKLTYVNEFPPDPVDDGVWFQQPIEEEKIAKTMRTVMLVLSDLEQKIIHLRYTDELPLNAIAKQLGVSECHVSQLHRRALEKMRPAAERMLQ